MLKNYLKIAWRNFSRNLTLSAINILGLSVGLAATMLIALYVAHEYSFDRFNKRGSRIVLAQFNHFEDGQYYKASTMSFGFGDVVRNSFSGVEDYGRITEKEFGSKLVGTGKGPAFFESDFRFADSGILRLFSFPFLVGNSETALTEPSTVLLTESTARKYFGSENPLGKTITYDKKYLLRVVGVVKDLPANSSVQFDFLADLATYRAIELGMYNAVMDKKTASQWADNIGTGGSYETYFLLHSQSDSRKVEKLIPGLLTDSEKITGAKDAYELVPLFDLHFSLYALKGQQKVSVLAVVAFLTLLLALINYVNLATARASVRAKEVSVRKIVGAARKALMIQFYAESFIYVTIANILALVLFVLLQPLFYDTLHQRIDRAFLTSPFFLIPASAFWILSVLLAGSYPALLLSGFAPIKILKGRMGNLAMALKVRNGLTVIQFTVSLVLIICIMLVRQQLSFMLGKNLGIDRDRVVTVFLDTEDGLAEHYKSIRQEISLVKGVESVTASNLLLYDKYANSWRLKNVDKGREADAYTYPVDGEFIKTMDVKWAVQPRNPTAFESGNGMVINQTAAKQLGINQKEIPQSLDLGNGTAKEVVGIVKDFHYANLAQPIKPMALFIGADTTFRNYLYVRIADGASSRETIAAVQKVYERYRSFKPFEYSFLNETYRRLYSSELEMEHILTCFTVVALLIACLGLFGLATFAAEQRKKEIGIRKVLGANVARIVSMLSMNFIKLVFAAIVISTPIAWFVMQNWLRGFAYKIEIEWRTFLVAAISAIAIALVTVSSQAIKAALLDPVKTLHSD